MQTVVDLWRHLCKTFFHIFLFVFISQNIQKFSTFLARFLWLFRDVSQLVSWYVVITNFITTSYTLMLNIYFLAFLVLFQYFISFSLFFTNFVASVFVRSTFLYRGLLWNKFPTQKYRANKQRRGNEHITAFEQFSWDSVELQRFPLKHVRVRCERGKKKIILKFCDYHFKFWIIEGCLKKCVSALLG